MNHHAVDDVTSFAVFKVATTAIEILFLLVSGVIYVIAL
jgi:hypothetical protein